MLLPSSGWPNLVHVDVEVIWEREYVGCVERLAALWPGRDILVLLPPCRSRYDKFAGFHFSTLNRYTPERTKHIWHHTLPFEGLHKVRRLCSSKDECSTTVRSVSWWLPLDTTEKASRKTRICGVAAVRSWNVAQKSEVGIGTIQLTKQTRFHYLMTETQPPSERFSTKPIRWNTSNMSANVSFNFTFRLPCIPYSQFFHVSWLCPSGIWRRVVWYAYTDV